MVGVISGISDEHALVDAAVRLGAFDVPGWSDTEQRLAAAARCGHDHPADLIAVRDRIQAGEDPLGEAFCRLRGRAERRALGQTLTPPEIIGSMISWAARAAGTGEARSGAAGDAARPGWSTRAWAQRGSSSPRGAGGAARRCSEPRSTPSRRSSAGPASPPRAWPDARACCWRTTGRCACLRPGGRRCFSAIRRTCATTRSRRNGRTGCGPPRTAWTCRPAAWPGCTCISSSPPRCSPRRAISAPSSPPRSGST